jgi:ketosteroid isomerase-like protein
MKRKISYTIAGIFFLAFVSVSFSVKAQTEWTPVQKEVWKNVTDYWALMAKGDVQGFLEYFHKDYLGWDNDSPLPSNKEDTQKWITMMFQGVKIPVYQIDPVGIRVYGDVAFVHYYYSYVKDSDGKRKMESGRWTDILMKQGSKWVLIGDHGGSNPKQD